MTVVLARVDNRLIHGQVLEAWLPHVQADYILVVDDAVAQDPFRRQLMAAVVPGSIQVVICAHAELAELCERDDLKKSHVLALFSTPADALQAFKSGLHFAELNLGNMHLAPGKRCVSRTLYLGTEDLRVLAELSQLGVVIHAQCIPTDRALNWDYQGEELRP